MTAPVLEVVDLKKHFTSKRRGGPTVRAVDGVSFEIQEGKTLGLVGESGCGKSTTARTIIRLLKPTSGAVRFLGTDISGLSRAQLGPFRSEMQMVFQDPFSALDPRMTIHDIVAEPLRIGGTYDREGGEKRVVELLETVGLDGGLATRTPAAFSGGQRQRVGIARALATRPKLMILDEPVSALDVSIQAQVINLLQDLQEEFGIAYLLIAHDLAVVRHISHDVGVMYLGRIVERGSRDSLYDTPSHPYSQALLSAVPDPTRFRDQTTGRIILEGDIPNPSNPPSGCRFRTRCWLAEDVCGQSEPALKPGTDTTHHVSCHFA